MFRTCFAATIVEVKGARQAVVTSRFDVEPQGLPNDANLLSFCFPLGPSSVAPREYQATEVSRGDTYCAGRVGGAPT